MQTRWEDGSICSLVRAWMAHLWLSVGAAFATEQGVEARDLNDPTVGVREQRARWAALRAEPRREHPRRKLRPLVAVNAIDRDAQLGGRLRRIVLALGAVEQLTRQLSKVAPSDCTRIDGTSDQRMWRGMSMLG